MRAEPNPFLAGVDPKLILGQRLARAREVEPERHESERQSLIRRAREARLDPEKRRVADYCLRQMESGRQDVSHLTGRLNEIMREYERKRRA